MITSVPFTAVRLADEFWRPRLEINRTITLPFVLKHCAETGRTDNFVKAAGRMAGSHEGYYFNVGHLYEAAVAHYRATGKRTLLDVALKNADLIAGGG